ncbi:hypothetical protein BX666DRAFT_2022375 [Dichotomocladium elegans]|nr:hypothetical protein BX666DRAFT_2022375 [Dichotomocladium elegans]
MTNGNLLDSRYAKKQRTLDYYQTQCPICDASLDEAHLSDHLESCLLKLCDERPCLDETFGTRISCPVCKSAPAFSGATMKEKAAHLRKCAAAGDISLSALIKHGTKNASAAVKSALWMDTAVDIDLTISDDDSDYGRITGSPLIEEGLSAQKQSELQLSISSMQIHNERHVTTSSPPNEIIIVDDEDTDDNCTFFLSSLKDGSPVERQQSNGSQSNGEDHDRNCTIAVGPHRDKFATNNENNPAVWKEYEYSDGDSSNKPSSTMGMFFTKAQHDLGSSSNDMHADDHDMLPCTSDSGAIKVDAADGDTFADDEYFRQVVLGRVIPPPYPDDPLIKAGKEIAADLNRRKQVLHILEKVLFNCHIDVYHLCTLPSVSVGGSSSSNKRFMLNERQADALHDFLYENRSSERGIAHYSIYEEYTESRNTLLAIDQLTELDVRFARFICILDTVANHPYLAGLPAISDIPTAATVERVSSNHSQPDGAHKASQDPILLDAAYAHSASDVDDSKGGSSDDGSIADCYPEAPSDMRENITEQSVLLQDGLEIYDPDCLTDKELNYFAEEYGLKTGTRSQVVRLLSQIWSSKCLDDGSTNHSKDMCSDMEPGACSTREEIVSMLKSHTTLWEKILRYEVIDMNEIPPDTRFSRKQLRTLLDEHGLLDKSQRYK